MDSNQLAEALARAVEVVKPAAEYCFLARQDHWWTVCMTKAEWSGWMQAVFSVIAIWAGFRVARRTFFRQVALEEMKSEDLADVAALQAYWQISPFAATRTSTLRSINSLFRGAPEVRSERFRFLVDHFRATVVPSHFLELLLPAKDVTHHTVQALANMKWCADLLEKWSVLELSVEEEAQVRFETVVMATRVFDGLDAADTALRAYLKKRGYSLQQGAS